MKLFRIIILGFLLSFSFSFLAQKNLDSLYNVWKDTFYDQGKRLESVDALIFRLKSSFADSAISLSESMYSLAVACNNKKKQAKALNLKGISLTILNRNTEALQFYRKSLEYYKNINDTNGIIAVNNNIGILYNKSGNESKALAIYYKNQNLSKISYDTLAWIASNINISYLIEGDTSDSSRILIDEAYELCKKIKNEDESFAFVNYILGYYKYRESINYRDEKNFNNAIDSAKSYLKVSYDIYKANNNQQGIAFYYEGLAELSYVENNANETLYYIDKALELVKKIKGKGIPGNSRGMLFYWIPFEISTSQTSSLYYFKYFMYKQLKENKKALKFFEKYHQLKDSVDKTSAKESLLKYEFESKRLIDSLKYSNEIILQQAETKAKEEEIKMQRIIEGVLLIGILLVIGFLVFVYKQLNTTKAQKLVIEEKQHEITDSINYAKRIQDAMMTSSGYIIDALPESFIYFKPKDVVSGDFYWAFSDQSDHVFFTVADCTGHGVPGAFMSMIGTSLLNKIIIENKIKESDQILNELRIQIINALNQREDGSQKDGMDISLCKLDVKNKTLQFSGAMNPLIHIRKDKLNIFKGDPQPIGYLSGKETLFTSHSLKLKKGDMIYLFSDGFQDQFGGEKGKKYRSLKFRNFLHSISDKSTDDQEKLIDEEFINWLGDYEQIDDVCIMGVRIT